MENKNAVNNDLHINLIFSTVKMALRGEELNVNNIISVVISAMRSAENFSLLPGAKKKELVCAVLVRIADEITDDKNRENIKSLIQLTVPALIDSIISASSGLYEFNKKVSKCWGVCC